MYATWQKFDIRLNAFLLFQSILMAYKSFPQIDNKLQTKFLITNRGVFEKVITPKKTRAWGCVFATPSEKNLHIHESRLRTH